MRRKFSLRTHDGWHSGKYSLRGKAALQKRLMRLGLLQIGQVVLERVEREVAHEVLARPVRLVIPTAHSSSYLIALSTRATGSVLIIWSE